MKYRSRSPFLAGLLSILMPGLGHIYTGEPKRGLVILCVAFFAGWIGLLSGLLPYQPFNVLSMSLLIFLPYLFAVADSVKIARRTRCAYTLKKYNKWYIYLGMLVMCWIVTDLLGGDVLVKTYKIPAGSMEPTLHIGDHILVNKFIYWNSAPNRGDVIVFEYPPDPSKDFVKRVVGVAGDVLELRSGQLILNGKEYVENYIDGSSENHGSYGPVSVPEGSLFVLGDNRDHSYDSRFWGFVRVDRVKGKVACVYWSWLSPYSIAVRWNRIGMHVK